MAIYVTMNIAYAWALPVDVMAKSKLVAADVAELRTRYEVATHGTAPFRYEAGWGGRIRTFACRNQNPVP